MRLDKTVLTSAAAGLRHEIAYWLLATLVFTAWLVWGPTQIMNGVDYGLTHHFFKIYLKNALWHGELPLWNPYTLLGRPFLADPEVAAYYPPTWLFIILPETFAYWLVSSLHFAIGGWGMAKLAHEWGSFRPASIFAGVAFIISPPFLGHLQGGLLGFVCTIAWWPWLLFYTDRLCERPSAREILILTALLTASFLAGHTHAFWLCGCSLGFYILPRCADGDFATACRRTLRSYGLLALATLGALSLAAIELLPLLELSAESNRVSGKLFASYASLTSAGMSSLIYPISPSETGWWDGALYVGLPVTLLGFIQLMRVRDVRMRSLACMALVCCALALGQATPLFDIIYPFVPAMGMFRFNNRFAMFLVFALILAAAVFWKRSARSQLSNWPVAVVTVIACYFLLSRYFTTSFLSLSMLACTTALVWACWRHPNWRVYAFCLWGIVSAIDFFPAAVSMGRSFQSYSPRHYSAYSAFPPDIEKEISNLRETAPIRFFLPHDILKANSGMVNHYSLAEGNVALSSARVWNYLHYAAGIIPSPFQTTYIDPGVHDKAPFPYKGANILVGWNPKQQQLILCPPAMLGQRAWLTHNVIIKENYFQALGVIIAGFNPLNGALLEDDYASFASGISAGHATGSVQISQFSRNRTSMTISTETAAVLVLAEAWFPGWQARIDGVKTTVFPVNVWMRGVTIPAGTHNVVFEYHSTYLVLGIIITLSAISTWILAWLKYRNPPRFDSPAEKTGLQEII